MRTTPRVAGFRSESPAGFELECMAGFVGIRSRLPPALQRPATYVLLSRTGAPLGFLAPFFPEGSTFVQYNFAAFVPPGSILERRARTILAGAHPDRTFVIMDGPPDDEAARVVRGLGFRLEAPCLPIGTALRAMTACPLLPTVPPSSSPSSVGHTAE